MTGKIEVNAMGEPCPIPVVKAKKALDHGAPGDMILVYVDNEIAVQNLTKMAKSQKCASTAEKKEEKHYVVTITVPMEAEGKDHKESARQEEDLTGAACFPDSRTDSIVVVSSATMGTGNDELGKALMKGFLYALSQLEQLPKKILFYNGGVTLTTEGSESLEDLKTMEGQGVEILSCGTCLNYYNLADKLKVGEVTNMYNIVEAMAEAGKIIRP